MEASISYSLFLQKVVKDSSKTNCQHNTNDINNQLIGASSDLIQSLLHAAVHVGDSIVDAIDLGAV
jgi:hypothetical protein